MMRLRGAALIAAAALVLHELRYLIAYGEHAGREQTLQGHAYLSALTPVIAAALALAVGHFLLSLGRARTTRAAPPPSRLRLWTWTSSSLLAIYAIQELIEGRLSHHHADGFAAVFAHGGWISVVLAIALGGLVALLLHEARVAEGAAVAAPARPPVARSIVIRIRAVSFVPALNPVARHLAARGPPVGSVRSM